MKRKCEYIVVVLLAILLMVLASCRSKRVAIVEKLDSVAIHNVCLEDSIRSDVSFSFEEMLLYIPLDTSLTCNDSSTYHPLNVSKRYPLGGKGGLICVRNGRIEQTSQEVKKKQVCDSLSVSSENHTSPLSPPPKPNCWFIIGMLIGVVIIIIASRTPR